MPPKKSKKGKKGKKDPNALAAVDKTFYELTITDLNHKLARLRAQFFSVEEKNLEGAEKLRQLENDRADVAAHLERTLLSRNNTIAALEERLEEMSKERGGDNRKAQDEINELKTKYKAMFEQLTSEIKLLTGKLNSFDEFLLERDALLKKFEHQEELAAEKEKLHNDEIYNMEQRAAIEKDALKKEVEKRLLNVSEDFMRSSEIRSAGYTRRLIRENIALQKEIDVLIMSQIKLQQQFHKQREGHREMIVQYKALDLIKNELVRNSVNKIKIIEGLTKNYEKLKAKYVKEARFRQSCEAKLKKDICEREKRKSAAEKVVSLSKRIDTLILEKNHLQMVHAQHDAEIQRLRAVIEKVRTTVTGAIKSKKSYKLSRKKWEASMLSGVTAELKSDMRSNMEDAAAICKLRRDDLLTELINIVGSQAYELPRTSSEHSLQTESSILYEPGRIGFMRREKHSDLMDTFQREIHTFEFKYDADSSQFASQLPSMRPSAYVEPHRLTDEYYSIMDVGMGSPLYVSSSRFEETDKKIEDEPLEDPEPSSSSISIKKVSNVPSVSSIRLSDTLDVPVDVPKKSKDLSKSASRLVSTVPSRVSQLKRDTEEIEEELELEINLFY